jgi:alpha-tubulin suppressor-like RCC1 family protein
MTVVVALGRSTRGQLGLNDEQRKKKELSVAPTIAFQTLGRGQNDRVMMAACGADFTVLLLKSGLVWSSGCNLTGQLGNPAVGAFSARPVPVKNLHEILKVSCGTHYAAAISQSGDAFVWGLNDSGQLGLDHRKTCNVPTKLQPPTLADPGKVEAALSSTAVHDAEGESVRPHCEDADILRRKLCHPRGTWPEFVAGMEDRMYGWREISCGLQHTLSSFRSREQRELHIVSCGSGAAGCLGHGDTADLISPLELAEVRIRMLDVIQVAAGAYHSVLLCRDSSVWTFGFASEGRLGYGASELAGSLRVPRRVPSGLGIRQLQPCSDVALESGWARGLDVPAHEQFRNCLPRRVDALNGVAVVEVSCGSAHTVALAAEGSVWGWGSAKFGQLGGRKAQLATPKQIQALCNRGIVGLQCGAYHTAAVTGQGSVLLLGMNEEGQCGSDAPRGSASRGSVLKNSDGCVRHPRTLSAAIGVSTVACGDGHTIVIAKDGPLVSSTEAEEEPEEMPLPPTMRTLPSVMKSPSGGLLKQPRLKFSRSAPVIPTAGAADGRRLAPLRERFNSSPRLLADTALQPSPISPLKPGSPQRFYLASRESSRPAPTSRPRGDLERFSGLNSGPSVADLPPAEYPAHGLSRPCHILVDTPDAEHSDLLMSLAAENALAAYAADPAVVSPEHLKKHKFVFCASLGGRWCEAHRGLNSETRRHLD